MARLAELYRDGVLPSHVGAVTIEEIRDGIPRAEIWLAVLAYLEQHPDSGPGRVARAVEIDEQRAKRLMAKLASANPPATRDTGPRARLALVQSRAESRQGASP